MTWWGWILVGIYLVGFGLTFHFQTVMAPNATLALIFLRCALWPIYWATGWPHGVPMTMD